VRRLMRLVAWPDTALLERRQEHANAARLVDKLRDPNSREWHLFSGDVFFFRAQPAAGSSLCYSSPHAAEIWAPLVSTTWCADAADENRRMRPSWHRAAIPPGLLSSGGGRHTLGGVFDERCDSLGL
jgi:hypothetical protein